PQRPYPQHPTQAGSRSDRNQSRPGLSPGLEAGMSLRLRAVLIAGIASALLWTLAAAWMLQDVHGRLDRTLDQPLAMSPRMVSGLMQQATLKIGRGSCRGRE